MKTLTTDERRQCVRQLLSGERISSSNSGSKLLLFAMAVGLVLVASAGVGREVVNARALAAQVEEVERARDEASRLKEHIATTSLAYAQSAQALARSEDFDELLKMLQFFAEQESEAGQLGRSNGVLSVAELAYGDALDYSHLQEAIADLERQRRNANK